MSKYRLIGSLILIASAFSHVRYLGSGTWNLGVENIVVSLGMVIFGLCFILGNSIDKDQVEYEDPEEEKPKEIIVEEENEEEE